MLACSGGKGFVSRYLNSISTNLQKQEIFSWDTLSIIESLTDDSNSNIGKHPKLRQQKQLLIFNIFSPLKRLRKEGGSLF